MAGAFDVVISCDSALPHLLSDADVERALRAMSATLRPGGLLVISARDYDAALVHRPATAPPVLTAGPPVRLLIRFAVDLRIAGLASARRRPPHAKTHPAP